MKKPFLLLLSGALSLSVTITQAHAFRGIPDLIFSSSFEPCGILSINRDFVVDEFEDSSGLPWGQATGASNIFALMRNQYSAQEFISPDTDISKRLIFENGRPSEGGIASYTATISTCPGDFSDHLGQVRCKVSGQTPTLRWATNPAANPNTTCILDKDTTYYLNIVHSVNEASDYTASSCANSFATCGVLYAEIF
ncbi:hypothetical protein [Marinicella sp. W31]|uniref:hypothetical protein n=1 Tax=Marinicella sp. W31 TaxID=3023713 RepID=UPI003757907E